MKTSSLQQENSKHDAALSRVVVMGCFVLLCVAGAKLRTSEIMTTWFSVDEGLHIYIASMMTVTDFFQAQNQAHPQGYFVLLKCLLDGAHISFDSLRWFSFLFGMLVFPVLYLVGKEVGGRTTGLVATALLAASTGAIVQSQIIRVYSLLLLLSTLLLLFVLRYLKNPRTSLLLCISIVIAFGIGMHYGFVPLAVTCVFGLFARDLRRIDVTLSYTVARYVLLFLPVTIFAAWLAYLSYASGTSALRWTQIISLSYLSSYFSDSISEIGIDLFDLFLYLFNYPVALLVLPLYVLGIGALCKQRQVFTVLLSVSVVFCYAILAIANLYPFGGTRHLLFLFPFVCLPVLGSVQYMTTLSFARTVLFCLAVFVISLWNPTAHISTRAARIDVATATIQFNPIDIELQFLKEDFQDVEDKVSKRLDNLQLLTLAPSAFYQLFPAFSALKEDSSWHFAGREVIKLPANSMSARDIEAYLRSQGYSSMEAADFLYIAGEWDSANPAGMQSRGELAPFIVSYVRDYGASQDLSSSGLELSNSGLAK